MNKRHLVLSDIHENSGSLERILVEAERTAGGFDDIWVLGDIIGHADRISGKDASVSDIPAVFALIHDRTTESVFGNWEYWLTHPEDDSANPAQAKYRAQLEMLRVTLSESPDNLWAKFPKNEIVSVPVGGPCFTLFHGCSFMMVDRHEYSTAPWESYLYPKDLNRVTRGLFENANHLATDHFCFGHTHLPGYFVYSTTTLTNAWMQFSPGWLGKVFSYRNRVQRFGINPGSVGDNLPGFPRTAVIIDPEAGTFEYVADPKSLREISQAWNC